MLLIVRQPIDEAVDSSRRPDVAIALVLLVIAWLFTAWLGFTLLDHRIDNGLRLTALGLATSYYVGAFLLVSYGRRSRWRREEIRRPSRR